MAKADLLQGTLDLLLLRVLALGPNHGWGISQRIRMMSDEGLNASEGSLYPALHRLELRGDLRSRMITTENNRRARLYTITRPGLKRLEAEKRSWNHFVISINLVLEAD